jgi:prevent-host-death family protein
MEQDLNKLREVSRAFKHFTQAPARLKPLGVREVPVKEAKAKLTELLRAAEAGERIVLTRHGKPVADLVPHSQVSEEKPMSLLDRVHAWNEANPGPDIGWVSPDFDEQLPEDFLLKPFPDDFDEKLAEHDQRVREAWAKFEAENPKADRKK